MAERAEKQQEPKTEAVETQTQENSPESLQIRAYQAAAAPPEPPPSSPNDPNSWQSLHSRLGNQHMQRLLTPPTLQFHHNTIHSLQSTIGNQAIQRLLTSSVQEATPTIQRRVPQLADIDDEALQTADTEDNEINRQGLRVVLRRAIHDMGRPRSDFFLMLNYNGSVVADTLTSGTTEQLMDLVRLIERDHMTGADSHSLVFEDTTATAVPIRRRSNYAQIEQAVNRISDLMIQIGTSATHDQHLQDIFGTDPQYGWEQAKARFPTTARMLRQALTRNHIRTDQTGSAEEMDVGASTVAGTSIVVTQACVTTPDSAEAFRIYSHEAFHYAYADIRDEGGYRTASPGFDSVSPQVRFNNADHYGEVCRRANGTGDAAPTTPDDDANRSSAVDMTRQAWNAALTIFESFRSQYNRQQRGRSVTAAMANTLLHHSMLFQLTYHQRHSGVSTPINQIDLALAEGVARRLSEAMDAINTISRGEVSRAMNDFRVLRMYGSAFAYVELAMMNIGAITSSTRRDARMVRYLVELGDSVVDIQDAPPDYL